MKQVNGNYLSVLVNNNSVNKFDEREQQNKTKRSASKEQAVRVIENLFASLMGIYPAWQNAYPTEDSLNTAKNMWLLSFKENHISLKDLELGLIVARRAETDFMPSVGKFISWIKQEKLKQQGVPDVEEIKSWWHESRGVKLETLNCSEQIYWVLVDINKINKNPDSKELIGIIKQARQNAIDKLKRGEPVPKRELTLENKPFEISVEPLSEEYKSRLTDGLSLLKQTLQRGKAC